FGLLNRVSLRTGFAVAAGLCLLPAALGAAALATGAPPSLALPALAVTGVVGLYMVAALFIFTSTGVERVKRITERIAAGELISSIEGMSEASTGSDADRLWRSILGMNERLGTIVRQVRASAETIVLAA